MKLADYLAENTLTPAEFARLIGVKSRMTIHRYLSGSRIPSRSVMEKIEDVTNKAVTYQDFYDPSPPKCLQIAQELANERTQGTNTTKNLARFRTQLKSQGESDIRVVYPWSRPAQSDDIDRAFDLMMSEPLEGHDLSGTLRKALKALGNRASYECGKQKSQDRFILDNRPVSAKQVVAAANTVLSESGKEVLAYPGLQAPILKKRSSPICLKGMPGSSPFSRKISERSESYV